MPTTATSRPAAPAPAACAPRRARPSALPLLPLLAPLALPALAGAQSARLRSEPTGSTAGAVAVPVAAATDTVERVRFDIPAGPLAEALTDFARHAGVRVVADSGARATMRTVRSPGAVGFFRAGDALGLLVQGTGLAAWFTDAHTVVVGSAERRAARAAAGGAQTLGRVVVAASVAPRRGYATARTSTATKTDTPLRDTPQAVTIVSRQLVADQAMQSMADVVRFVPGVQMGQGEGHRDAPTIRGNSSTADFFLDGVRDDAQYLRDLYNVERVEALKGSNAMIFGRGGGGGVINRVSKQAEWTPTREVSLAGSTIAQRRAALDVGQGLGARVAVRLNGLYENSDGFRDQFTVERWGINPTASVVLGARTMARVGYERFVDARVVDRGIPSFAGRPSTAPITRYFGIADSSHADTRVHNAYATLEHVAASGVTVRNRTQFSDYEKFYQNVFPGAMNAAGTTVAIAAYSSRHDRRNLFNQTDLTYEARTGALRHTLLGGVELGRQTTDNLRLTGYFGAPTSTTTSVSVPFGAPTPTVPVGFRPSATDANNHVVATVAAAYVQDQVQLSPRWQAIAGLRHDRFALSVRNNRDGRTLERTDALLSPRAGLVFKPTEPVSLYGSYGVSFLPSAGDQFASLTATTQTLKPERFDNRELGVKWDARPALAVTLAAFELDRANTTAPDPLDATRVVQTGSQRSRGVEVGVTGEVRRGWQVAAGFTEQRARITSTTSAARAGQRAALVPRRTASLWNRWQATRTLGVGAGAVHQTRMFAAIDNAVTLPGFTRLDGALYANLPGAMRVQLNVENLLDTRYYATSHGNNNIMPGASRTVRATLGANF